MNTIPETPAVKSISTRYGDMTYFAKDSGAIRLSLEKYGEWAENEISFIKKFLQDGDTVIDVGAYIGTHTLAFARHVGLGGSVIAIEAQKTTHQLLIRNIEANALANVRIENAIAGAQVGDRDLLAINPDSSDSFGSASVLAAVPDVTTGVTDSSHLSVRQITLDSLDLRQCQLIKIDAEGMEHFVLQGASSTLRRLSPVIYAECNSLDGGLKTWEILKGEGYQVFAHVVDAYNEQNFMANPLDIFSGAREVALVGVQGKNLEMCRAYVSRKCEMVLELETADDLALALFNKPQYVPEILRTCAAARTGGALILDTHDNQKLEIERSHGDVAFLRDKLAAEAAEKDELKALAATSSRVIDELQRDDRILRQTIAISESHSNDLRFRFDQITEEKTELHHRLTAVYGSMSWKITAPLRAVISMLRGQQRTN